MPLQKISFRLVQELKVGSSDSAGVFAASGLVKIKNFFYVIADDELSLAQFCFEGGGQLQKTPLLPGHLPTEFRERKKAKPDWESLCQISFNEMNGLLAVPSGSTEFRDTGVFVPVQDHLSVNNPIKIDFKPVFFKLRQSIPDLNIEGAAVFKNQLKLFQRGNGLGGVNAIIDIDLSSFCDDFKKGRPISASSVAGIKTIDLGELGGVKLGFTDACTLGDSIWFLAVAENSKSTYEDGSYSGAILGELNPAGEVIARYDLDCLVKPEGLWVEQEKNSLVFYFVTDADNRQTHSALYFGRLQLS